MNKLISVIIPVKNGAKYLKEAIDSIKNQNMNTEIIVVDDCSSDDTVQIAQKLGCKIIRHEVTKGQVIGKNNGLKEAKGEYVLFLDHDDIMTEGALKRLYDEFEPDTMAVEAKVQDFYSPELTQNEKSTLKIKAEPYFGLFTGAILIKKEVFDKIGLFNENIQAGEIIEWHSKMTQNGAKIKKIDFVSSKRRVHLNNYGRTHQNIEFKDYAALLRAKLKNK